MLLTNKNELQICFEDDYVLVVDKPSGVLSQPGKTIDGSIATAVKQAYPDATGPLLVHRLDMDTSGLLILAKNRNAHRHLQQQFEHRQIYKRYVAVVATVLKAMGGLIELPLRLDVDNRPSQIVCFRHGKQARTLWYVLERYAEQTRIGLIPVTGRTHQLRVHAADQLGLNAAIVGDRLYGQQAERLLLHAERIEFTHPHTNRRINVISPVPF